MARERSDPTRGHAYYHTSFGHSGSNDTQGSPDVVAAHNLEVYLSQFGGAERERRRALLSPKSKPDPIRPDPARPDPTRPDPLGERPSPVKPEPPVDPIKPEPPVDPVKPLERMARRDSRLSINANMSRDPVRVARLDTQSTRPERSVQQPREDRKQCVAKDRPTDNKPKGGGGSGKSFVPWKEAGYCG